MPFGVKARQDGLDDGFVARFGGAHEIVVGKVQLCGERLPNGRKLIAVGLGTFPARHCHLLDFLAVLIQPGQEERLLSQATVRPRDYVSDNLLIGMAKMRLTIDVIYGGCDVKALAHVPLL